MAQVLPATIEALNMQQTLDSPTTLLKKIAFPDIPIEKRFKREVSLPNGVENWNISNFESYLNFDDNNVIGNTFEVLASADDRMVPETEQRDRCSSISSVSSSSFLDEKPPIFHNFGVKTMSIKHMGSGSTCISSDHSYFNPTTILQKTLDPEETYQNLDMFLHAQEVPEITDTLSSSPPPSFSPMPSTSSNDSSFDIMSNETSTSFSSALFGSTLKRPLESISEDDVFMVKHTKTEFTETVENTSSSIRYNQDGRKKGNNSASSKSSCRKTRKEKQKEMEHRVTELEQEKENLRVQVQVLEELIQAHKQCLLNAIAQKR